MKKNLSLIVIVLVIVILASTVAILKGRKQLVSETVNTGMQIKQATPASTTVIKPTAPAPSQTNQENTNNSAILLSIASPADGSTVSQETINVSGKTAPKAEMTVNDTDLVASPTGDFSTNVALDEGENNITVTTNDEDGNFAEQEITVTYDTGQ